MPRHGSLAADLNEVLEDSGAGDAHLGDNDAAAAQPHVVSDLDQVIEARAGADPRSMVVLAPTSTSSSTIARPSWGMLRKPDGVVAKLNPSWPIRAPG